MRRDLLKSLSILPAVFFSAAEPTGAEPAPRPPNFLLIQTDDMGVGDLGISGNRWARTPVIDQLARESVRFRNFYVHSVCAPTRASLLTGRHFLRTGVSGVHGGRDFLHLGETTIGELLRDAGYATAMYGKWHLGKTDGYYPWDRGFSDVWMADLYKYRNARGWRNGEWSETQEWSEELATDMAIEFLREHAGEPFFLYMPYMTPHEPYDAPDEYVERHRARGLEDPAATLYAMLEFFDDNVGRLLDELEALDIEDHTIVLFMSDNGPWLNCSRTGRFTDEQWAQRNPLPYRGNKGQNWENGIISPLFVRWKGTWQSSERFEMTSVLDVAPTLLGLAGVEPPEEHPGLDGHDMTEILASPEAPWPNDPFFIAQWNPEIPGYENPLDEWTHYVPLSPAVRAQIRFDNQRIGIRNDRYKLLWGQYGGLSIDNIELRDMWTDPWENTNVHESNGKITTEMLERLRTWYDGILNEPHAYTMPVFLIGHDGHADSPVPAYAPAEIEGGLWNSAHALANWRETGDAAHYDVDVQTAGRWTPTLEYESQQPSKARVEVSIAGQTCQASIDGDSWKTLDPIELSEGNHRLTIRLIEPSKVSGVAAIERLSAIRFRR